MRVTLQQLQAVVDRINKITESPMKPYMAQGEENRYVGQIGNYRLDSAYGGYALHRMVNTSGAITDVFRVGHVPKAELLRLMFAFIEWIDAGINLKKDGK